MKTRGIYDSDTACPHCRNNGGIDWTVVVQVCAHCGAKYKVTQTAKRRWSSFLLTKGDATKRWEKR